MRYWGFCTKFELWNSNKHLCYIEHLCLEYPNIAKPQNVRCKRRTTDRADINRQKRRTKCQRFTKLKEVFCQYTSRPKTPHLILPNRTKRLTKTITKKFFYLPFAFCLFNLYSSPHFAIVCITGDNVSPNSVKVYSTFGGISA